MKYLYTLCLLILAALLGAFPTNTPSHTPPSQPSLTASEAYSVASVIDGDTITVTKDNQPITVRLLGIDTPEVDPRYNSVECYGEEATKRTRSLLENQSVHLELDSSQDQYDAYGRLLAYVSLTDGTMVNHLLIEEGYAKEYTFKNPYRYQSKFRSTEAAAKQAALGLWSQANCPTEKPVAAKPAFSL